MKHMISSLVRLMKSSRLVAAFAVVATVAALATSSAAAASPNYFSVPKPTSQRACYKQYGEGWNALGFRNLDHCLRYVSTKAPMSKADCNRGWWYVWGFNSREGCVAWVVMHGGSGYAGALQDRY